MGDRSMAGIWQRILQWARSPIRVILLVGLIIAVWLGNDYGATFDEGRNANKGAAALRAYAGSKDYFELDALPDHGPIYFMLFNITAKAIHSLAPSWPEADGHHFTHSLMFLLTVYCFYRLSLRFMGQRPAWMATILFATQPLLFGNGFINQKDTPFMALFIASLVSGLAAADRLHGRTQPSPGAFLPALLADLRDAAAGIRAGWTGLSRRRKGVLAGILLLLGLLMLDLLWIGILRGLGESVLAAVYHGTAPPPLQRIFDSVATDAYKTPLEAYLAKFEAFYTEVRLPLLFLLPLVGLVVASRFLPGLGQIWGFSRTIVAEPMLWTSAFLLGATVCVRQLGVFVGGLVSLFFLYRTRLKSAFPLVLYWATGAAVTYATWPYLWPNPIRRFMESLFFAAQFPPHHTFFEGRWMSSRIAPWYYFPKLAAIELTEPAVVLLLLGAAAALWRLRRNRALWFPYSLLALWVGVPFAGLVFFDMTAYGNIRHLLFALPALLILAGIGLEAILQRLHRRWAEWLLLAVAVLPGVWALIWLHPYEYIYMNSLVGGVSGAYGEYELDRQCISLREAIEEVNRMAAPGATVMVMGQISAVVPYARLDLRLVDDREPFRSADYVLSCYWQSTIDLGPEGFDSIYKVRRGEAVLTELWRRQPVAPAPSAEP
jgi:hypothetical protein